MKSKKVYESINFRRGENPYNALNLGNVKYIFDQTAGSYYRDFYSDEDWTEMIKYLLSKTDNIENIIQVLLSKHIRWSHYDGTFKEFKDYYDNDNNNIQKVLIHGF